MTVNMSKGVLLALGIAAALPGCSGGNGNNSSAANGSQDQSIESMGPDGGGNAFDAGQGNGAMDQGAAMMDGNSTNGMDAGSATAGNSTQPQ